MFSAQELAAMQEQAEAEEAEATVQLVEITPAPTQEPTPFILPSPSPLSVPSFTPDMPSPSPAQSDEPEASPTPAYTVESVDDKAAYLNAGSANLRKGPGTDYDIIREISLNTKLTVTGKCGEWYRVEHKDDTGYVLAEFVEYGAPPTAKPTTKPTTKPTAKPSATPAPTGTSTPEATAEPTATQSSGLGASSNDYFSSGGGFTADELLLIAQVVQRESSGSYPEGQVAVANVIYNRIKSSKFPDTVSGVIYQKSQFTVANSTIGSVKPGSSAVAAVKQIFIDGQTILPSNVMYFRSAKLGTSWSSRFEYYGTYGANCFFIFN